jgi:hypothetical protein
MARPKKPVGEARGKFLRIRLTDDERRTLDEGAKANDLETSTWARVALLALARKAVRTNVAEPKGKKT